MPSALLPCCPPNSKILVPPMAGSLSFFYMTFSPIYTWQQLHVPNTLLMVCVTYIQGDGRVVHSLASKVWYVLVCSSHPPSPSDRTVECKRISMMLFPSIILSSVPTAALIVLRLIVTLRYHYSVTPLYHYSTKHKRIVFSTRIINKY